ncbi:MAG TPA: hypothetical protein VNM14_06045 [Planctomycetota bacterium]|jgi:hypothetical protein|nr:hypothetical protein [Planctomycetota bacterium]
MLTKIETKVVRQTDSRRRRAWYQSASADAILVHDADTGEFLSFELEWEGRRGVQRSYLTWTRGSGLRTGRVDTGESGDSLQYKAAPMIVWDRQVDPAHLAESRRLIERSCIEEGLRESILKRLAL